jgi:alpha-beta hydrolase superfamily lysophospholipase
VAVRALQAHGCLRAGQTVGLFGFSAGGAAVLYALAERKVRVDAAVTLNAPTGLTEEVTTVERATGRPYRWSPASRTLAARADAAGRARAIAGAAPPALLMIQGDDDKVVSGGGAAALEAALRPLYQAMGEASKLRRETAAIGHDWTGDEGRRAVGRRVADWFNDEARSPRPASPPTVRAVR